MNQISSAHLTEKDLLLQLEEAHRLVEVGSLYRHYRNKEDLYKVTGIAILEATQEPGIIYQKQCGSQGLRSVIWIRPLSSWLEKIVNGDETITRFQKVL